MIRYFTAHPTIANLLMIGFLAAGLIAGPTLLRETFPRAGQSEVEVTVAYPGARPEDVETAICARIEDALDAVTGIDRQSCEAREGLAKARIEMRASEEYQAFVANVTSEIDTISDFPDRAEAPRIRTLGQTDPVISVAITGPQDRVDLHRYAEEMRTRMLRWGGIPKVDITGFSNRELQIGLKPSALRDYGVSVGDVARAVQSASLDLPAGSLTTGSETFLMRVDEERQTAADLEALVIRSTETGGQVLLGEIAQITEGFSQTDNFILFDGRPAAILEISKTRSEDSLRIIDTLNDFLDAERQQAPPGVVLEISADAASVVRERLALVVVNGLQGLALVFAVLWLFFGFRFSFWVAMGLPVSFMGGVALMAAVGYSLNLMTTLGLLIVIGLLMDDAIVIAENIARLREKGRSAFDAAVEGASQVFPNVLASFATTAMVFGSLAFLQGDLGAILRVVPVVMLFVLSVSLIEAFLILPHHLVHALDAPAKDGAVRLRVEGAMAWMRDRLVGPFVDLTIRWRYATAGLSVTALLVSITMLAGGYVKFTAFPELDGDTVVARVLLPQGTPQARTAAVVAQLETGLERVNADLTPLQPEQAALVRHVTVSFGVNRDAFESGEHVATVSVDLLPSSLRNVRPDEIMRRWQEAVGPVPDVLNLNYAEATIGPAGIAIDLRLRGDNLAALGAAADELRDWIGRYQGVTSVMSDLRAGKRELQVSLRDAAGPMGITAAMVADQLRAAYFGLSISEIQRNGDLLEITAQYSTDAVTDQDQFMAFDIYRSDGSSVPLSMVADVTTSTGYSRINRENGRRTVTVQGTIDTSVANANAIVADTLARFAPEFLLRHPDVTLDVEGQNAEAGKTQQSMVKGFVVGLVGVFLLLSFLFRSYVEPIVVMLIIPLSLTGTIFGHMAMGLDFSMPSMLGYVALAGVVINNSILLVDFIKNEHGAATTVAEAAVTATQARFRAIFLTSLTTVAGLTPILLETSLQAQILIPLVASLVFGLFYAGIIVLFALPALYAILDDFGLGTMSKHHHKAASGGNLTKQQS
ncbi:efflux RND transporter permease subunit [Yoonia sediminilitoris]|uniref:Multidrug efflux pump subunit AcrB n=1 Tax=Yoonia sediminilitoris TaxID=1286148 RepID=A0A2T6K898_9RHOB|nr:efflux RND transporter permease subunit [Yoonia sediminilitoris]PUB10918.1 multidrug efflux pump subunit AcrB [Yoonia sediminilitoris]RCW90593.1 multidrug efflux pump subunit AcrB [Yoonia sediminilitoris]